MVTILKYGNTHTYLISGKKNILVDTDYYGTITQFYKEIKKHNISITNIDYVIATHYHPDHMGLISELNKLGIKLIIMEEQLKYVHFSDYIFNREKFIDYEPINENNALILRCEDSRDFLKNLNINGEVISTPSHSDDSISIILDDGTCIVGDLEPYEYLSIYKDNNKLLRDWEIINSRRPKVIYYSHMNEKHL